MAWQIRSELMPIRFAGLAHDPVVVAEDLDDLRRAFAGRGNLVPELHGRCFDLRPFVVRNGRELHFRALGTQAAPHRPNTSIGGSNERNPSQDATTS